jgi:uncharacterized protein YndB with AHSA1/START domain
MDVTTPNGPMQMWFTGEYREVIENKHLVYTDSMSNPDGDIIDPSDIGCLRGTPLQPRFASNSKTSPTSTHSDSRTDRVSAAAQFTPANASSCPACGASDPVLGRSDPDH